MSTRADGSDAATFSAREDLDGVPPAADRSGAAVELRHVSMRFRRRRSAAEVVALDDISLSVGQGEFLTVLGPSGCGKSTLLRIAAGLQAPSAGEVAVAGLPVEGPRSDVGVVFQQPVLFPWRTVMDNVMLPADILRLDRAAHLERARDLIRLTGLDGFEHAYPRELSGGMQQRAAIARTLLHNPGILLMDEPFGALDYLTREQMNIELLRIWQRSEKTIVLVTHSIPEAVFLGMRVVVFSPRPGRIVAEIKVPFDYPREAELMATPRFAELTGVLRGLLAPADAAKTGDL